MIICKNADEIRKALWEIAEPSHYKHGKSIQTRCDLAGADPGALYRFTGGKDIYVGTLCRLLDAFGYRMAIVKDGESDESTNQE